MLIWDYIRDFLVQYIFGGYDSNENVYDGFLGYLSTENGNDTYYSSTLGFKVGVDVGSDSLSPVYMSIGDWLSTTTTIIIMCLIVVLFALLVRWVFKTVVSAFLLR